MSLIAFWITGLEIAFDFDNTDFLLSGAHNEANVTGHMVDVVWFQYEQLFKPVFKIIDLVSWIAYRSLSTVQLWNKWIKIYSFLQSKNEFSCIDQNSEVFRIQLRYFWYKNNVSMTFLLPGESWSTGVFFAENENSENTIFKSLNGLTLRKTVFIFVFASLFWKKILSTNVQSWYWYRPIYRYETDFITL